MTQPQMGCGTSSEPRVIYYLDVHQTKRVVVMSSITTVAQLKNVLVSVGHMRETDRLLFLGHPLDLARTVDDYGLAERLISIVPKHSDE